ncbi:phospholipid carrier-dependent glycosyltransferase [Actinoplanes sp. NPDC051851]|uniref:dolichyl-phosphate-mannose--protein mannosyltransferase n=1 Tax=Actinoplanes sp. NPDC051851 TaxID=3154753 RepID=UPI003446F5AE
MIPAVTTATIDADITEATRPSGVPDIVRRRLATLPNWRDPYSWLVTLVVVVIGAILRFERLGERKGYIFDEVYYPTDAWDMLTHGVEWDPEHNAPGYVVHPPLGKWLIALGELVFGNDEVGWRVSSAVAGTLMILILVRVAYRLFHSVVLAGAAGLLLALDGFQLVLSRTSLLDIFLGLFVLAGFAALLLDRDHYRRRLLRDLEDGVTTRIVPWWLLVAGVLFGMACGVKWSALFFLPVFAALTLVWRWRARRTADRTGLLADLGWGVLSVVLTVVTYLSTWAGWLLTDDGFYRHYRRDNGLSEPFVIGALRNLWHYHHEAYTFHAGLTKPHTYQSWPWQWLLLGRPVLFEYKNVGACGDTTCVRTILLLGTPLLWWSFLPALAALIWFGLARRDWRAWAILAPVAAGYLPWFYYAAKDDRTMFSFYLLPAVPFLILAVVHVLGAIMTPPTGLEIGAARTDRQIVGTVAVGAYVLLVAVCFAYFHPIFVNQVIEYDDWTSRMWLGNRWI